MNAEQVVKKILAKANAEADKIKAEANEKCAAQEAQFESELTQFRKETEALATDAAADRKARMLASARMDIRKELLTAKVELLDEVFKIAKNRILQLSDEDYQELIGKLMEKAIETGDEEVITAANETRIDNDFIKHLNRKLGSGYMGNLRLASDKADIEAGFILRRKRIQVNASLAVLLAQIKGELEIELAHDLFENNMEPQLVEA